MKKAIFKATSLVLAIILTAFSLPTAAVVGAALEVLGETTVLLSGANTTPNVTADDVSYTTYTENGVTKIRITRYKGTETELVFPNELNGMVIGAIGSYAFSYCSSLTNIILPDGVTSIGVGAFSGCSLLEFNIYDNEKYLGNEANPYVALINATSTDITSCTINANTKLIADSAFSGCSALESITVENGNTVYHSNGNCLIETASKTLIRGCNNSTIPTDGSVTSIGDSAFFGCDFLANITLPDSVTLIGNSAFSGCSSLASITIPEGVTSIGEGAFEGCSSLASITIPEGVTSIGSYAFSGCDSLTSISIPEGVTSIGDYAFYYCSSLTSISISDGVTSIGFGAFYNCSSLTSITIPDGVTTIGNGAFEGCDALESITVENGNTFYHSAGNCLIETSSKILIKGCNNSIIPADGSVTSIGSSAFYNCSSLASITIPDSVTSIGVGAFYDCSLLTSITIPEGVSSIGWYAFSGCDNLCVLYNHSELPFSIGSSDYGSIAYYAKLIIDKHGNKTYTQDGKEYIDTPEKFLFSKTSNEKYTLIAYFGGEETVTLPTDVNGLTYAINLSGGVRNVIIPSGFTEINSNAFNGCSSLISVTIPAGVTAIGDYAFNGCSSLTSISIPDGVTSIGERAFSWCSSLTSIIIPEGATYIGDSAFSYCSSLKSITIPESVTSIGYGAFYICTALKTIYGVKGSYAETYANKNGYTFIALSGATLSGTIKLPKSMDGVTVLLYSSDMSDADIRADMKKSNPEKALAFTASMGEISSVGDTYTRQFTFNGVTAGSYKLAIHKAGAYTVEIKGVTTEQTNIDVGEMSIGIMGDADGNGEINSVDYSICKRIVLQSLKNATERNRLASDVNGNGDVDTTDYAMIKRHVLGTYTIG